MNNEYFFGISIVSNKVCHIICYLTACFVHHKTKQRHPIKGRSYKNDSILLAERKARSPLRKARFRKDGAMQHPLFL